VKQKIVIFSAQDWELTDKQTGEFKEGCSITYMIEDPNRVDSAQKRGETPVASVLDRAEWPNVTTVPGLYECDFVMFTKKVQGKAIQSMKPARVKCLGAVDLFKVVKPPVAAAAAVGAK